MPELPDVEVFKQYLDATSLHQKIEVLAKTIERRAEPERLPEFYLTPHRHQEGKCPRCGESLRSAKVSERTAYFCERRQG